MRNTARTSLWLFLLTCACGCTPPDLGDAPFYCNIGMPKCPEGYHCVSGDVCVRDGVDLSFHDGGKPPDKGEPTDGKKPPTDTKPPPKDTKPPPKDTKPPVDTKPPPKDTKPPPKDTGGKVVILITEFMPNPAAVLDSSGEWLELFNPGNQAININGWTLKDLGVDKHVIAHSGPLMVPAKGYLVLGISTNKAQNGNVNVAYAYKKFLLANSSDEVQLLDNNGQTVDSFAYSPAKGFNLPTGASLSVKYPNADKNLAASWCVETKPWSGSKGDKGTPIGNPGCK